MADWLNNDLSDYIDKKEKILVDVRVNNTICRISSVMGALIISLVVSFAVALFAISSGAMMVHNTPDFMMVVVLAAGVFICSCPLLAGLVYNSMRSNRYVLTDCGIYAITGLIFKKVKFVAYNQITDVSMSRGPIQSIVGVGTVGVGTASGNVVGSVSNGSGSISSMDELSIESVDNYKQIKDIIAKNRKK